MSLYFTVTFTKGHEVLSSPEFVCLDVRIIGKYLFDFKFIERFKRYIM